MVMVKMAKRLDRQGKEWACKTPEERKNADVFW